MIKGSIIVVYVFFFLTVSSFAQKRDTLLVCKVFKHGLKDTRNLVLSPAHWDKKKLLVFGGVSATTGALILWGDQPIYDFANTIHSPSLDVFFSNTEPLGHLYPMMAISAMLLKGLISHENYSIETSFIAAESLLLSTGVVQLVKNTASRTRPNNDGTISPYHWNGPFFKGNSFYSGHTAAAFSVASVFACRYRDIGWTPLLSYGLATIAGAQRIYENRHWASDVFMGAVVGTVTGIFLCKQWEKNSIKFYPEINEGGLGLSMVIPID